LKFILLLLAFSLGTLLQQASAQSFKDRQIKYPRVGVAVAEKESVIRELFKQKKFHYPPQRIFIRVFKHDSILEVWVGQTNVDTFALLKEYKICAMSGSLGPKRQQGDGQVPEGFYHINHFNPNSYFYLSLGINYPNQSDRILGVRGRLGGSIYIHGSCVTIGCVPITDEGIKELYLIAVEAKSAGQSNIPVHIFPTRLDDAGMGTLRNNFHDNQNLLDFWANLKEGFDFFERNHRLPGITVDGRGRYIVNKR